MAVVKGSAAMIAVLGLCAAANAGAVRAGFEDSSFAANDDGSLAIADFGLGGLNFYGTTYTGGWLNNNGNITFDAPLSTFTPFSLLTTTRAMLAPFFGDVDTRAGNLTKYGFETGANTPDGGDAFGFTWREVGYFSHHTDKLNTFQLIIYDVQANGDFCFEFNYDQIEWETGDASAGSGGLGGFSARAGWSDGVSNSFEISGSAVNGAFLDSNAVTGLKYRTLNSGGVAGRFTFCVENGSVVPGTIPLPSAAGMGLAGLGLVGLRRRR